MLNIPPYFINTGNPQHQLKGRASYIAPPQDKEEVECHYEEKNENACSSKLEVELVETALRETTLRETRIDEVLPQRAEYIHTLEAQSSVDSDVIGHNVRYFIFPYSNVGFTSVNLKGSKTK